MKKQVGKNKISFEKKAFEYSKYKWEFLRRNPEFIKDWEKLVKEQKKRNANHNSAENVGNRSFIKIYREHKSVNDNTILAENEDWFCKKWACHVMSPHNCYDHYHKIMMKDSVADDPMIRDLYAKRILSIMLYPSKFGEWPISLKGVFGEPMDKTIDVGIVTVDINLRYSKKILLQELEAVIDYCKPMFPQKGEDKKQKRYHIDNFDLYLKVYDLRKEKKSWRVIAKALGLNDVQTVRNYYNAACELIKNGIDPYIKFTDEEYIAYIGKRKEFPDIIYW